MKENNFCKCKKPSIGMMHPKGIGYPEFYQFCMKCNKRIKDKSDEQH